MIQKKRNCRIIISGGGTGGHIFPALSIAGALKKMRPDTEFLFVGAEGKMEMQRVPAAGYKIVGLPVAGLQRSLSLNNLSLPFKVLRSLNKAGDILDGFTPDLVVGVGGYASAPLLWKASSRGIPCLIQEQNSYAGLTNRILGRRAELICTAYDGMEKFFPKEKIILTGNPIREGIHPATPEEREEAFGYFGLNSDKKVVLVVGGSLGCGTFNSLMRKYTSEHGTDSPVQFIWQNGGRSSASTEEFFRTLPGSEITATYRRYGQICNCDFITRMDMAFAAADLIVSRAGAGTISELCAAGKPTIFVPSPIVAEDHQTHNAMSLVNKNAAMTIPDSQAPEKLMDAVMKTVADSGRLDTLHRNILALAKRDAALQIAEHIFEITDRR